MKLRRAAIALLLAAALARPVPTTASLPLTGRIIVLDPGHATINFDRSIVNNGKSRDSIDEHRLTLEIATYLGDLLKADGATVYITRTRDDYWRSSYSAIEDNKARAHFANEVKADILIAIHCDWHPSRKFYGVTTFYSSSMSRPLGEAIQRRLVVDLKTRDRGTVRSNFTVLDNAKMPAVLVETGFMSHRQEGKKLLQTAYQKKVATAMASAVRRYFSG